MLFCSLFRTFTRQLFKPFYWHPKVRKLLEPCCHRKLCPHFPRLCKRSFIVLSDTPIKNKKMKKKKLESSSPRYLKDKRFPRRTIKGMNLKVTNSVWFTSNCGRQANQMRYRNDVPSVNYGLILHALARKICPITVPTSDYESNSSRLVWHVPLVETYTVQVVTLYFILLFNYFYQINT